MDLQKCEFKIIYSNNDANIIVKQFFVPALQNSIRYDRGVGYFTSGWLRDAARGMVNFAEKGGKARWLTSPKLDTHDWNALDLGNKARTDQILYKALERDILDLYHSLEADTLAALAWMVADNILDFKLAIMLNQGNFHVKFGLFYDLANNVISFTGSYNDSRQGNLNFEEITTFRSWDETQLYVNQHAQQFETLWDDQHPNVRTFDLPEATRHDLLELRQNSDRPYSRPTWQKSDYPRKAVSLWEHQIQAIQAWEDNDRIGILSMATGSGKTFTAISAFAQCDGLKLTVLAVPRSNLVDQWAEAFHQFDPNIKPILVYENSSQWQDKLFQRLRLLARNSAKDSLLVIGTMTSLSGDRFQSVLADAGTISPSLLIVDEAHNIGAPKYQAILSSQFQWRLALSATPKRHFDEEGSQLIENYFGGIIFSYTMKQALDEGKLTPYNYYIYPAYLNEEEYEQYLDLTRRIISLRGDEDNVNTVSIQTQNVIDGDPEEVKRLLIQRARILKKATEKVEIVANILEDHTISKGLVYCADNEQLEEVHYVLENLGLQFQIYTSTISQKRRKSTLSALEKGFTTVLLAIDCLDEGVDIPLVNEAIILASSANKRQFIQRRGRILRRAPGKSRATLIDVIAVPPISAGKSARFLLNGELIRAKEMAELAENKYDALLQLKKYTEAYGVFLTELLSGEGDD